MSTTAIYDEQLDSLENSSFGEVNPRSYRAVTRESAGSRTFVVLKQQATFADQILALASKHQVDAALDLILLTVRDLLRAKRFRQCDKLLTNMRIDDFPSECILAFVSGTRPSRESLQYRPQFLTSAGAILASRHGEKVSAQLLGGLE